MKVGCPMLKLKTSGKQSGRSGNMKAVLGEAFEVDADGRRWSKDADASRAGLNEFTGYRNAFELMKAIESRVEAYNATLKEQGKRGVREDAVKAVSTVIKPPAEEFMKLSKAERDRYWDDTLWVFGNIVGRENIMAVARHLDEDGDHLHVVWMPFTSDGRLCAKEMVNLQLFSKLNRDYPRHMRARGWDVEELKTYDEEAVKNMTEEEAAEYKAKHIEQKRKKHGKSVSEYKREQNEKRAEQLNAQERQIEAIAAQAAADRAEAERLDSKIGIFGVKADAKRELKEQEAELDRRVRELEDREKALCERVEAYEAGLEARAREIAAEQFKAASGALKPSEREIYEALRTQELEMNGKRVTFEQFGRMLAMKKRKQKPLEQVEERLVQEVKQEPKPSLDDLISRAEAVSRQEAAKKLASGIKQPKHDNGLSL